MTPLHCAAQEGHEAAAEELIVKGADVNAKDEDGYTPLHSAAGNGHKAIVEMLIGKGAEPNAKADGGKPNPGMVKPLDSHGYRESAVAAIS
ncbi:Serine/threonine-protein phosphatase 6 regulatory ankyrin repeat subunit A [Penaeus vannamei]|uniref:Serine/threonine-protein phosphatase 6 regulatory ankyrin repeat subunit A n=1 Tax=Penaeus vannamei TaxID=6689 RepID=A0A3R7QKL9_PENVA|nr:Serine/threonine-protein phosphatase 6 regulatory ankyrin repeat subunit A [Penaeus vannamei]